VGPPAPPWGESRESPARYRHRPGYAFEVAGPSVDDCPRLRPMHSSPSVGIAEWNSGLTSLRSPPSPSIWASPNKLARGHRRAGSDPGRTGTVPVSSWSGDCFYLGKPDRTRGCYALGKRLVSPY